MKITITIDTSNDAFTGRPQAEVARILVGVVDRLASGTITLWVGRDETLKDLNGNKAGDFIVR